LVLSLQGVRPDTTEHLLNAVREMLQVARAVLDAAEEVVDQQQQAAASRSEQRRVRHIDIG